jgi:hypothetical protein
MDRNWTPEEKARLVDVWNEPCSLKALAAQYFPGRSPEGLKAMGKRLELPSNRKKRLQYRLAPAPGEILVRKALEHNSSLTCYEIEIIIGSVTIQTIQEYVKRWFEAGELHIVDWRRRSNDGHWSAAYKLGKGVNVPRPAPKPAAKVSRERYARQIGRMKKNSNPFLAAAGFVQAPAGARGRVYKQAMNINDEETEAAA